MRYQNHSEPALAVQVAQQFEHALAVGGVEVAGRLVGQQDLGPAGQGTGDGRPLHLAAGELGRQMGEPVPEPDSVEQVVPFLLQPPALAPVRPEAMADQLRHEHVLEGGQLGQQVIKLEDESERAVAMLVALAIGEIVDPFAVEQYFTRVGCVEQAEQVEQRALARAAGSHDGDHLSALDVEVDPAENRDLVLPFPVALVIDHVPRDGRPSISPSWH